MATYDPSTGRYIVSIGGVSAHKLGRTYTITVKTGKGQFPVKLSALSYANGVMQTSTDDDLKRAVIALYKYYAATMAYRGTPVDQQ